MSLEPQKPASVEAPAPAKAPAFATVEVPVTAALPVEKVVEEKVPEAAVPAVGEPVAEEAAVAAEEAVDDKKSVIQSASFKEDTNVAAELSEAQKKALEEFKELVREALNKREFSDPPPPPAKEEEKKEEEKEEKSAATEAAPADEVKPEEKPDVETVPEVKSAAEPAKLEEKPAASEAKEEKSAAPPATEAKKEEKPVAPPATEAKKEEKPVAPPAAAAPPAAETKTVEKPAAPPAATEPKTEEKPAAPPAAVETKTETSTTVTIAKAFAADEDGAKTVEAIEESIVAVSAPAADTSAPTADTSAPSETPLEPEEVSIWGIPLLQDDRSDVVLLKFLRARDFKVKESLTMLKNTIRWRREFKIDELLDEDLGTEFEKMVFIHGVDKLNHPVCYNSYNEFQNKQLFADKETRAKFLRWRVQFHEKCVRALDFSPTAVSSFVNVSDFRNAPGLGKRAIWQFIKQAVKLFEDNYPEFVAKELFINVPWWYIPYYRTIGSLTSPRTTSKMVLSGPSKSADTIFKYIAPEQVPVKYGGLSSSGEQEFSIEDTVTEVIIKPAAKHTLDLPASEGSTLVWELRVLGSEVSYGAQFEPTTEGSYAVIVSKTRKIGLTDEPVITDSFKVGEPGKVVLTIDNQTSRKKKLLYRLKTKPRSE